MNSLFTRSTEQRGCFKIFNKVSTFISKSNLIRAQILLYIVYIASRVFNYSSQTKLTLGLNVLSKKLK